MEEEYIIEYADYHQRQYRFVLGSLVELNDKLEEIVENISSIFNAQLFYDEDFNFNELKIKIHIGIKGKWKSFYLYQILKLEVNNLNIALIENN